MSILRQVFLLPALCLLLSWTPPAAAKGPVQIAAIFAMSGTAAVTNHPSIQAVRWAVHEINASGGINGRPVDLLEIDNTSTPIGSKIAAEKAVAAGVAAIIGPAYSSHCIAAARVAQRYGIPLITNVATDPDVTRVGDFIFRVCFSDTFQSKLLARFARRELGLSTAAILVNANSDYSLGLAREFRLHFKEMGGSLIDDLYYKDRQESFSEQIQAVQAAHPQLIFIPGYLESALIAKKLTRAGINATFLGGDGWDTEDFKSWGGDTIRTGYYTTHWSEELQNEKSREFVKRYGDLLPISSSCALAYDAVMLLADACRRAGSIEHDAIRRALASTTDFEGVTGKITLNDSGDPVKPAVIIKILNGQFSYLKQVAP
jgi:branched-chain amino acid transport system substrate-binding protein